ncbi:MAG: hypothetical protein A2512_10895 [Deltaproteobacteria bacterium RIFOXYD12_FULL_56_24]|nr:MAG: hypothetical protein A2512_10895 [Deltaproteobacteria bacterium RIFOXYD12_FULL_56_24]
MRLTHVLRTMSSYPGERNAVFVAAPEKVTGEEPQAEDNEAKTETDASVVVADHGAPPQRSNNHGTSGHRVPQVAAHPEGISFARADKLPSSAISGTAMRTLVSEPDRSPQDVVPGDRLPVVCLVPDANEDSELAIAGNASQTMAETEAEPLITEPKPPPDTHVVALVEENAQPEEMQTESVQIEDTAVETDQAEDIAVAIAEKTPPPSADEPVNVSPGPLPGQKEQNEAREFTDPFWQHMWNGLNEYQQNLCQGNKSSDLAAINTIAEMIMTSLMADNTLIRMLFAKKRSDDLTSHQLDMSVVATKMGIVLGYEQNDLRELTLCAMLHDIGMLRVSPTVVMKKGKLEQDELAEIKKHPIYSYEILKESGLPAVIAEVARQVHERTDGSGYPRGLRADEIHEYASIISLADTFTAMLQPRPQRKRKIPFEIVKEIIERGQGQLSRRLMKVLIDEFAIFPVGLYVQLNTGEIAMVHKANRLAPLRPEVTVLTDARGRRLTEPKQYNLMHEPLLTVVDSSFDQEGKTTDKAENELEENAA